MCAVCYLYNTILGKNTILEFYSREKILDTD